MNQAFESARPTGHRLKWKLLSPLAGSSSPSYVQLDWRKVRTEDFQQDADGEVVFTEYERDPRARFLPPRLWRTAGLAGIKTAALEALKTKLDDRHVSYHEGVAFSSERGSYLGLLPDGITFGTINEYPDEGFIAGRIGYEILRFAPILFTPEECKIYEPNKVQHRGRFAINDMADMFPDVPLT